MSFSPFLTFDGTCGAAMDFYADCLGADEVIKSPFSEAPPEAEMPASDRLMYAHVRIGEHMLMGFDVQEGEAYRPQASVHVTHFAKSAEDGREKFDRLATGGEVTMPYQETFFAHGFGTLKDKFGTHWMVMIAKE